MKEFKCENGHTYILKKDCCLNCKYCFDIWYDYTNGPYAAICYLGYIKTYEGLDACRHWVPDKEE